MENAEVIERYVKIYDLLQQSCKGLTPSEVARIALELLKFDQEIQGIIKAGIKDQVI